MQCLFVCLFTWSVSVHIFRGSDATAEWTRLKQSAWTSLYKHANGCRKFQIKQTLWHMSYVEAFLLNLNQANMWHHCHKVHTFNLFPNFQLILVVYDLIYTCRLVRSVSYMNSPLNSPFNSTHPLDNSLFSHSLDLDRIRNPMFLFTSRVF